GSNGGGRRRFRVGVPDRREIAGADRAADRATASPSYPAGLRLLPHPAPADRAGGQGRGPVPPATSLGSGPGRVGIASGAREGGPAVAAAADGCRFRPAPALRVEPAEPTRVTRASETDVP